MTEEGGCCWCFCRFIFTLGLTALFLWLSLRTSNPTCSIDYFYLPALNRSLNSPKNTTIAFTLKLNNGNKDKGIYYDAVNLTLSYIPNKTQPIGNYTIPAFRQGHNKKAWKGGSFVLGGGQDWEAVFRELNVNPAAPVFRVDLVTAVRFRIMVWKTKRYKIMVGGNVAVNDHGTKEGNKGIKLKSGALKHGCCRALLVMVVIFSLLILNF